MNATIYIRFTKTIARSFFLLNAFGNLKYLHIPIDQKKPVNKNKYYRLKNFNPGF